MGYVEGMKEIPHSGAEDMSVFAREIEDEDLKGPIQDGLYWAREGNQVGPINFYEWDDATEYVLVLAGVIEQLVAIGQNNRAAQELMRAAVVGALGGDRLQDVIAPLLRLIEVFDGPALERGAEPSTGYHGMMRFAAVLMAAIRIADASVARMAELAEAERSQESAN